MIRSKRFAAFAISANRAVLPQNVNSQTFAFGKPALVLILSVSLGVVLVRAAARAEPRKSSDTLQAILDAAARREKTVRTLQIAWASNVVRHAEGAAKAARANKMFGGKARDAQPVTEESTIKSAVMLDGDRLCYTYDSNRGTNFISGFDGTTWRLFEEANSERPHPQGMIKPGVSTDVKDMAIKPVIWVFRLLNRELRTIRIEDFSVSDEAADLAGQRCVVIDDGRDASRPNVQSFWLDPARDHSVVRFTEKFKRTGEITRQVDISYRPHVDGAWMPSGWSTISRMADGKLFMSTTATVTKLAVNEPIAIEKFQPAFSDGTLVKDYSQGESARFYIVRAGGEERPISELEHGTQTYNELASTEPDGVPESAWSKLRLSFVLLSAAVIVFLAYLFFSRRFRDSRTAGG